MGRGKRYETEPKLNYQKVIAVIIAIAVVAMFIVILLNILKERENNNKDYEYFALYSANKWGVINQEGETVIAPSYQEMIVIPDKTKDIFICTYNINEETGDYETKVLNSKNEEIFAKYEQVEAIQNIDQNENVWYEKNVLKVKQNEKYGLIDLNGKELLPCEYEEIKAMQGIEDSILIKKEGKYGLANDQGSIIIEPQYKEIKNLGKTYKEGYITITQEEKYGVISATKKQVLENKYDNIEQIYLSNYYLVKEEGKQKLINTAGETIIEKGFDEIKSTTTDGVIFVQNKKYGEMNTSGEVTIEAKYQELKQVKENVYIAKQDDKYGIIDKEQNNLLPFEYAGIKYNEKTNLFIAEDVEYKTSIIDTNYLIKLTGILSEINTEKSYIRMRINDEYKYYNLSCEEKSNTEVLTGNTLFLDKKDGKYGYIDKKGNVVIDYIYDDATEQNSYGYASIKKDGLWGSIDKNGKIVVEPKYNLENNLEIDFIGKWHLGQDINMNYYCEM